MPDLFSLEWRVDRDGYQATSAEELPAGVERPVLKEPPLGRGWYIRRKGGPLRDYRPLAEYPGLARRFAYLAKEPGAILKFANEFGFLGVGQTGYEADVIEEHVWFWHTHIEFMRGVVEAIDADDKISILSIFNQHVEPHMTIQIEVSPMKRPALQVVPMNLLAAMWLQVAGELTQGTQFKNCRSCSNRFPFGPGTPHKRTKQFCADRCRKAWNRHQKKEN